MPEVIMRTRGEVRFSMPEQIIVLTALEVEYNAVYQHLTELETDEHESGTTFEIGTMHGCPWQVVIAELGPGNLGAAVVTTQAIQRFSPRAVLMVGIAGSLAPDKVKQGDVVIGTKTYWYHSAKHEGERVLARPDSWPGSHRLLQRAKVVTRRRPWGQARFGVHTKPIASGEVVLNSAESPLKNQLRFHYNDAVAIEMESAGLSNAAHVSKIDALTIRGISDLADGFKHDADADGWQQTAADNAATVARWLIRLISDIDTTVTSISDYIGRPTPESLARLQRRVAFFVTSVGEISTRTGTISLSMAATRLGELRDRILEDLTDVENHLGPVEPEQDVIRRAALFSLRQDVPAIVAGLADATIRAKAYTLNDRVSRLHSP
ncbi:5'-methylthioadenosine/S-adenosylhomocysteine nucleosidase [Nonomuraea sp. MCN248]|uniref:5'-methylthioadenosine/S-adenosylhomocysteine nucleosidase n=1 Tax=Nonomuraea corallina TaxID=2989783 RepID=A0ABT4SE78_9ACTN|nr:5'-methylthioadenosine/S-adenosylhomocysteine nucleosidase [Nonomuraea corallina]MDA0635343.1 5'-methylthioadenosine/S-adenosylhomocysteine nucleosidase [Nonomuraea corallina]